MFRARGKSLLGTERKFVRFYNLYPLHSKDCAVPPPIVSTFVAHTVTEALRGTAYRSTLHFALDFKTVSECGKIWVTEFKQSAVFVQKQLAYIPIVVLSDLLLLISIFWPLPVSASEQQTHMSWPIVPIALFVISVFRRIHKTAKRHN